MTAPTASQTIGPFWHPLADPALADLTRLGGAGPRRVLTGRVLDAAGAPVDDACVEIWQASPAPSPAFPGWGRCATDADGRFAFVTVPPDPATPYLAVVVLARGLLAPVWTRVYLGAPAADDPAIAALNRTNMSDTPVARRWRRDC